MRSRPPQTGGFEATSSAATRFPSGIPRSPTTITFRRILEATTFTRGFPVWARYAAAAAVVLVAFGFRLWFRDAVEGVHSLFFFPAIVLSAVLFDRGSGVVATLLSAALEAWVFPPQFGTSQELVALAVFIGMGIATAAIIEVMHVSIADLAVANARAVALNEQLAAADRQKATLLEEVRHRTKNELQLLTAILRMQGRAIGSIEDAREALAEAANRVLVLGRAHQRFSLQGSETLVNLCEFVDDLCGDLRMSVLGPQSINLKTDIDGCFLAMEKTLPLGLILNELVTNAIKYAFPDDRPGRIDVSLSQRAGELCVSVTDDGVGIAPGQASGGIGQRLIGALTSQLGGRLEVGPAAEGGTCCTVCFAATLRSAGTADQAA